MTLAKSETKNATSLYVTKCIRENGRRITKIVEKLGTATELAEKLRRDNAIKTAAANNH